MSSVRTSEWTFLRDSEDNFYIIGATGQKLYLSRDDGDIFHILQKVHEVYHDTETCGGGAGIVDTLFFHIQHDSREFWWVFYMKSGQRRSVRFQDTFLWDSESVYILYSVDSGEMYALQKGEVVRDALNQCLSKQMSPTAIIRADYRYSPKNLEKVDGVHIALLPLALELK